MPNKNLETTTIHTGDTIYRNLSYNDSIEGLDEQIVRNTLAYHKFIAEMSDNYGRTQSELAEIKEFEKRVGLQ